MFFSMKLCCSKIYFFTELYINKCLLIAGIEDSDLLGSSPVWGDFSQPGSKLPSEETIFLTNCQLTEAITSRTELWNDHFSSGLLVAFKGNNKAGVGMVSCGYPPWMGHRRWQQGQDRRHFRTLPIAPQFERHKSSAYKDRGHGKQGRKNFKVFRLLIKGYTIKEGATEINLLKSFFNTTF